MGSDLDVVRTVISRVGGRQRRVRVVYPWHAAERPESTVTGGVVAGGMAVVLTCLAAPLPSRLLDPPGPRLLFGALFVTGALVAAYYAVRGIYAGTRNMTGKHAFDGIVVDRLDREYGDPVYSVAVDDGSRDEVVGWAVGRTEYDRLVEGTPVRALVSGDRRYLYQIDRP